MANREIFVVKFLKAIMAAILGFQDGGLQMHFFQYLRPKMTQDHDLSGQLCIFGDWESNGINKKYEHMTKDPFLVG